MAEEGIKGKDAFPSAFTLKTVRGKGGGRETKEAEVTRGVQAGRDAAFSGGKAAPWLSGGCLPAAPLAPKMLGDRFLGDVTLGATERTSR